MANYKETLKRFQSAKGTNNLPEMEAVYQVADNEVGRLDKLEETATVDPAKVQRWNMLHGDICTHLIRLRKTTHTTP